MTEAVATTRTTVRLTFSGKQSARTILTVVDISDPVSKAYLSRPTPFDSSQT